ncbi:MULTISPECIES: HD-GYP domain-containing protein [Pseudomonas]|uniref:HD-GYP domain-containing protein n=1 Tax=Pseudomonas quercus TaxID=2722792 RepID=A0ABX0YK95_9PSED|nr:MULTISPECIES: HD-GYP domain-containing protein [Pseudomonas]MBF7144036.1 HD-GYP domain-containing protein [Pseudomonas sp. LY10J]NJP02576.1 HD-GYP domain-containing protein [Pseudomonas quercus]
MIRKISVTDLAVGMFLHEALGDGITQSLWKVGFKIQHPVDLERIRGSGMTEVLIDTARGLDVPLEAPAPAPALSVLAGQSLQAEVEQAVEVCARAKRAVASMFNDARLGQAISSDRSRAVVEEIAESVMRHPHALISLARLKTVDEYTYLHSVAVCGLMVALARQLGWPDAMVLEAGTAGLLHDIGKMAIPLEILNKPGRLTDEEFAVVRAHPVSGLDILRRSGFLSVAAIDVCLHHHEKFDGTGYPHGLAGEAISPMARMAAICDVYDAVTSARPYKRAWGPAHSLKEMASWKGHFDGHLFQAFVRTVGIYPIGALVRLRSDRLAVVIDQNDGALLAPKVAVVLDCKQRRRLSTTCIDLSTGEDRIVRIELAQDWGLSDMDQAWSGLPA